MVRINKTQSKHVDAAQRRVTKRFEDERALVQKRQDEYLARMNGCIDAIRAKLINLLGINVKRLIQAQHRGVEVDQKDFDEHESVMALVEDLSKAAVSLGQLYEKVNCFEEIRLLWKEGAISKQHYVYRFLQQNKHWSVTSGLEYLDLTYGVGSEGAIKFGEGIPATTKKAYRKKLLVRVTSRKMKK